MAKQESMGEALARLDFGQRAAWQEQLSELAAALDSRPLTAVLRVEAGGTRRVYSGWRAMAIAEVLDACAAIDGDWWVGKTQMVDRLGRTYEGYADKNGRHLAWRQRDPEKAKANARKQAKSWRVKARQEWIEYCGAYQEKFPGQQPIGFDRWCRGARALWLEYGPASIEFNDTSRSFSALHTKSWRDIAEKRYGVSGS